jgi:hypothetical protein
MLIRYYVVLFSALLTINFNSNSTADENPTGSPRTPRRNLLESPKSSPFMDPVVEGSPESVIYVASKEALRGSFLISLQIKCRLCGTINTEEKLHDFLVEFRKRHLKTWGLPNESTRNFMDTLDVKWEGGLVTIAGQPLPQINPLPESAINAMLGLVCGQPQAAPDDRRAAIDRWPVYPVSTDRKEDGIEPAEATPAHPQPSSEKVDPSESEAESETSEVSTTFLINPSQRVREDRELFNGSRETLVLGSHAEFERLSATGIFPLTPENPAAPFHGIEPAQATPAHPQPSSEKVDPSESEAESEPSEESKTFLINPSQRAREVREFFNRSRETLVPGSHAEFESLSAIGTFPFTPENPLALFLGKSFREKRPVSCVSHLLRKASRQKRPRSSMN